MRCTMYEKHTHSNSNRSITTGGDRTQGSSIDIRGQPAGNYNDFRPACRLFPFPREARPVQPRFPVVLVHELEVDKGRTRCVRLLRRCLFPNAQGGSRVSPTSRSDVYLRKSCPIYRFVADPASPAHPSYSGMYHQEKIIRTSIVFWLPLLKLITSL